MRSIYRPLSSCQQQPNTGGFVTIKRSDKNLEAAEKHDGR